MSLFSNKNILIISLIIFSNCLAQSFKTQHYTIQNGLPSQHAYSGLQDKEGYIWVTFDNSVAKYDGKKWVVYDSKSYFEKPNVVGKTNEIRRVSDFTRIRMDNFGKIWVVSRFHGDVFCYDKNKWQWKFKLDNGEMANYWDFNFLTDSIMVFYHRKSLEFRNLSGNIILKREVANYKERNEASEQNIKKAAILNKFAYFLMKNAILKISPIGEEKTIKLNHEVKSIDAKNGRLYFYDMDKVGYFDDNFREIVLYRGEFQNNETDLGGFLFENEHLLFWGNSQKLKFYDKRLKSLNNFNLLNGHLTEGASDIFEDSEKNIWIISFRGITKIVNNSMTSLNVFNNLFENEVTSIEQFNDGRMVFGHNDGLTICDFKKSKADRMQQIDFEKYKLKSYSRVQDMQVLSNGSIVLALSNNKLGVLSQNLNLQIISRNDQANYFSIVPFSTGQYLVGSNQSIFKMTADFQFSKIFEGRSRGIKLLKDKRIISFYQYGMDIISGTKATPVKTRDPNKNDSYCSYEYGDRILIGTKAGLFELKNDQLEEIKDWLPKIQKSVYFIEKGYKNDLWFGLQGGAIRFNTVTGKSMFFTPDNGLAGYETNRNAGFLDKDGNFWIGTDRGVSCFPRTEDEISIAKPRAKITEFRIVEDKYNTILLRYDGLSFIDEQKLKYEISLFKDDKLSETLNSDLNEIEFAGLNKGDYKIQLVTIRNDGIRSEPTFTKEITIHAEFYQTVWFYLLFFGTFAAMILLAIKYISIYKLNKAEKAQQQKTILLLRATEAERNRIAQDMHDSIAQSLVAAKYSIEALKDNPSEKNIDGSASLIIRAWKELKSIIYNLRPMIIESEGLNKAVESVCEQINVLGGVKVKFFGKAVQFDIDLDEKTIVYRIIQEGLNNILRHSRCKNAFIRFMKIGNDELILIGDDGKGFKDIKKIEGHGLFNIRQRCDAIGANLEIKNRKKRGMELRIILKNKHLNTTKFSLEKKEKA